MYEYEISPKYIEIYRNIKYFRNINISEISIRNIKSCRNIKVNCLSIKAWFEISLSKCHEILSNFHQNLSENRWNWWTQIFATCTLKNQQNKLTKICEIAEIAAVHKNAHLVDLIRSQKILQEEYLLAKIGVDTAENEPKVTM